MKRALLVLAGATLSFVFASGVGGCGRGAEPDEGVPVAAPAAGAPVLSDADATVRKMMAIQERHTRDLMGIDGVVGTAIGWSDGGELVVKVFVRDEGAVSRIPARLEGSPVEVEVTGEFRALVRPGGGGGGVKVSHTAKQLPPIKLGTSGGWGYDLANGYCCGGTLGSLVAINGVQYVLSNYHVLDADIVPGGNNRIATNGDSVIQPGLIDVGCNLAGAQSVGGLSLNPPAPSLPGSNVDAALAQVAPGMVSPTGEILEIGTLSATPLSAALNLAVKKSGRTTGLTRSYVSGLNATLSVAYDNECAGGAAFTKTYTGQIIVKNKASRFLDSGDSGSLLVEDVATSPRPVGLLFAGSSTLAVANPIAEVLAYFGATVVGN